MKKLLLLSFALMVVLITGCDDDTPQPTTTTLTLNFDARFGADEFIAFKYYPYENGDSVYINTLHFYVSNIVLLNGNEETVIKDVTTLSFEDNLEAGSDVEQIVIEDVPEGNYTGIRIGIGVDSILNHTLPADYGVGHPLANASEYWDWRETYIFGKFEGRCKDANGVETFYTYHPGSDMLFRKNTYNTTINLSGGVPQEVNFTVDFGNLFNQDTGKLDISNNSVSHTGEDDFWIAELIMNNLSNSILMD